MKKRHILYIIIDDMSTPNPEKGFKAAPAASARLGRRVLKGCPETLKSVPDPRIERRKRHRLPDILAIAVPTYMSGGDGFRDMERYGRKHEARLREFLELKNGVPSHDTFRRVLSTLRPAAFGVCVRLWQRAAAGRLGGVCVSLDGKAVRRACAKGEGAPVVETAWVDGADVPLGEVRVASKENETGAIPKLLSTFAPEGAAVTADAVGCQKGMARAVRAAKAHYLLPLKGNQPTMRAEVLMFMEDLVASGAKSPTFSRHVDKGHGRVEVRRVWHSSGVAWFTDRAQWRGFAMVETVRSGGGVGGKPERRCFITPLGADAKAFRKPVRGHWGVENRLHRVLDVVSSRTGAARARATPRRTAARCGRSRSCCCGATPSAAWASARCARSARGTSRRRRRSFLGAKGRRRPRREGRITPFSHRPRSGWSANPGTCPQGDRRAGMAVRRKSRNPVPPLQGTVGSF